MGIYRRSKLWRSYIHVTSPQQGKVQIYIPPGKDIIYNLNFSVLGLTIKTLGIMIKQYPGTIDNPNILYKSMLTKLKANITDKSDSPVGECFSFLSAFLAVYSDVDVADIYQCIKKRMSIENYRQTSLRGG